MSSPLGVALFSLALAQLSLAQNPTGVGNSTTTTNRPSAIGNLSFTSEPRGRGTVGLIVSCSITFAFCVWTAVHPNIIVDATPRTRFVYKATMMLVSIVVPEGVIMCAIGQLREARRINKAWRERFKDPKDQGYLDMDGAFFVVMGGFVIDRAESDGPHSNCSLGGRLCICRAISRPDYWVESTNYTATLTPAGFINYLEEGRINCKSFDKREIVDKGKANLMSKFISGFQAIWLIVVCISRLAGHLPLSLLEVHVLIQVVCTIATYFCWLNKPLDVNQPIVIKLQTPDDGPALDPPLTGKTHEVKRNLEKGTGEGRPLSRNFIVKRCPPNPIAIVANACYDIIVYIDTKGDAAAAAAAAVAVATAGAAPAAGDAEAGSRRRTSRLALAQPMLMEGLIVGAVGLLHAAAWNSHFPTPEEMWLWRAASIGMCVFPLTIATVATCTLYQKDLIDILWDVHLHRYCFPGLLIQTAKHIWQVASKHGKTSLMTLAHACLMVCCLNFLQAYLLCIMYITAESYASVRDPPTGTMTTPSWSNYWPHAQ